MRVFLQDNKVTIKERHLGLHRPVDSDFSDDRTEKLASLVEENLDMEELLRIAETANPPKPPSLKRDLSVKGRPRIAVAKDDAFCFYYAEYGPLLWPLTTLISRRPSWSNSQNKILVKLFWKWLKKHICNLQKFT